jgi:hypothetical protein
LKDFVMNAISPIIADDISAKKILITMFDMTAPARTAGQILDAHGEDGYPIMARHLSRRLSSIRVENDIWSKTLSNVFGTLLQGADQHSPDVAKVNARFARRDDRTAQDELQGAELYAACRALGIELNA